MAGDYLSAALNRLEEREIERPEFAFTGVILNEEPGYTSLCPELDVASQGQAVQQARDALLEAVTLYLETVLEDNLPWLRPIPRE